MNKVLALVATSFFLFAPSVFASDINDLNRELSDLVKTLNDKENKLLEVLESMPDSEIEKLNTTFISDDNMTEADVMVTSFDYIFSGRDLLVYYLDHLKKPIKVDAVGNRFR